MSNNSKFENRIGEKFEKLTIIGVEEHIYSNNQKYHKFLCRCDCGNEFSMFSHNWKKTRKCRKCKKGVENVETGMAKLLSFPSSKEL